MAQKKSRIKNAAQINNRIFELWDAQASSKELDTRLSLEVAIVSLKWTKGDLSDRETDLILESLKRVCEPFI